VGATTRGSPAVSVWVATLVQADLAWRRWLDDGELDRLSRLDSPADQGRFLLGAAMLRSAVGNALGVTPRHVPLNRSCPTCGRGHGRPQVPESALNLSVTHSGLVVAVALAFGVPVGVDVELVRDDDAAMTAGWTRAEARFKAGGAPELVAWELTPPLPGYVLSVATHADASVRVRPGTELLTGALRRDSGARWWWSPSPT